MSDLLKMYKALEDQELGQRIQGATVKYAQYLVGAGTGGSSEAFARTVLADPFRTWQDQQIAVVTNGTILAAVILQPDGAVYTGKVEDQDIEYVVESGWRTVAEKYAPIVEPEAESGDQ